MRASNVRRRVLDDADILVMWRALDAHSPLVAGMVRLILLTARHPSEVVGARWEEFANCVWTIPKERVTNGRVLRIPLSQKVEYLLEEMRTSCGVYAGSKKSCYVFPLSLHEHLTIRALQNAVVRLNRVTGLDRFSAHDLRRACATGMCRIGIPRNTVARVLNHIPQTITVLYNRYDEISEMSRALNRWGKWVDQITRGDVP